VFGGEGQRVVVTTLQQARLAARAAVPHRTDGVDDVAGQQLEAGRDATGGIAAGLDDLPLFSAAVQPEEQRSDDLRDALGAMDADAMSPREALEALYRLKDIMGRE